MDLLAPVLAGRPHEEQYPRVAQHPQMLGEFSRDSSAGTGYSNGKDYPENRVVC